MKPEARVRKTLQERGLAGLVVTTPENVAWLTGFFAATHIRHPMRRVYAVIGAEEGQGPDLVLPTGMLDVVAMQAVGVRRAQTYGPFFIAPAEGPTTGEPANEPSDEFADEDRAWRELLTGLSPAADFPTALKMVLTGIAVPGAALAVDEGKITPQEWDRLEESLPGVRLVPGYELLRGVRVAKTPENIEGLRASTAITQQALWQTMNLLWEGQTEEEVARIFMAKVAEQGGIPTLVCIGSGPRAGFPTAEPSERRLRRGDMVRFDVGCLYRGYHSDMARTAVMGPASPKQERYYRALLAGEKAALAAVRPGVPAADIFHIAVCTVRENGIPHYQRNHVGHGEGFEGYEPALLNPDNRAPLEEEMVLCVETPYYEVGFGGLHVEDACVVTADGCSLLSTISPELFIVG